MALLILVLYVEDSQLDFYYMAQGCLAAAMLVPWFRLCNE